jgi:uncharacterized membrane protein (UPF0127 family)
MLYAMNLIYLDRQHDVVDVEECVRPFRIPKARLKAQGVLGFPTPTVICTETKVGEQLATTLRLCS